MEKRKDGRMWDVIGEYTLSSPVVPDRSEFINGHITKKKDQRFEYTVLPTAAEYNGWEPHERQALEEQEWGRRENGVWFFNNGVPTWITGQNYFYLNYHRYGPLKPEYRESHRRLFWVWKHCLESPNCLGLFLHTRRRWGKTSCAASIALEAATRIPFFRVGIQSKTEDDAEALFLNEISNPFQALQECPWFLPAVAGTNKPKKELLFDTPTNRKKGAGNTPDRVKGLKSKIDWREGTETAYDSQGLGFFINDEVGKKQKFDSFARHSIVSKQFFPNGYVIGKEWASTTSDENDDDSVAKTKEFWLKSDQRHLATPRSRTSSGLFRYFVPDEEGYMVDEYGHDSEEGRLELSEMRATAQKDPVSWIRHRRAYPRTIEEAHLESVKPDCEVNAEHVGHVQSWLDQQDEPVYRRYDLVWADAARTRVKAQQNKDNGRFYISWLPPDAWLNQSEAAGLIKTTHGLVTKWRPLNKLRFCSGADPTDHKTPEKEAAASFQAFSLFYKYDDAMECRRGEPGYWPSRSMILEYAERMPDPDTYYEDVAMALHLFGSSILPETNRPGLINYLKARGYELFLSKRPVFTQSEYAKKQQNAGAASSRVMIESYTDQWKTFVFQFVGTEQSLNSHNVAGVNDEGIPYDPRRLPFPRTLSQLLQFSRHDTTKYDLAVSGGFALCDMGNFVPFKTPDTSVSPLRLSDFNPLRFFN